MSDRPARLVLDTSVIAAWTRGSVSVGELLAEIDLEHSLASAAWHALNLGVDVLTRYPDQYAQIGGGGIALPFDD